MDFCGASRQTIPYHSTSEDDCTASLSSLSSHEEQATLLQPELRKPRRWNRQAFCYVGIASISIVIGVIIGLLFTIEMGRKGHLEPFGQTSRTINVVWTEDATFSDGLNEKTEAAWASLMPDGFGLIKNPREPEDVQTVSAFHEIHCLHAIRTAYLTSQYLYLRTDHLYSAQMPYHLPNERPKFVSSSSFTVNPYVEKIIFEPDYRRNLDYVTHCFEYLRQALMCAADSNLEDTDLNAWESGLNDTKTIEGLFSSQGLGTQRVCRDYATLKNWSEEQKWDSM